MLQAPANNPKTKTEARSKTVEHLPEQGGMVRSRQTQSLNERDRLSALQKTYGNQAVLRMQQARSPGQAPVIASPLSQGAILQRKCACGNAAGASGTCATCQEKGGMALPGNIQTKLTINEPGDRYEQEADRVAEQVMTMPDPAASSVQRMAGDEKQDGIQTKSLATSITPILQREVMPEEEEESIQTKPALQGAKNNNSLETGHNLESRLNNSGSGSPLPNDVRSFMEPRFGADFSQVRVHTGGDAVQMNRKLNAKAFTHKQDIYFGAGKSPGMNDLTAHELTHVVQQHQSGALFGLPIIQRDADSDDYKQGYQDGLKGDESQAGPRYGDALTDYNEGYAKGHYEFTQASASPAPATSTQTASPAPATPDQVPTPAPATPGQTETPAPGLTSDDYKQGYQDGLNGGESQAGPRYGDALTDYDEGYAKGHYEFTQRQELTSVAPSPTVENRSISDMTDSEKLIEAFNRAKINATFREKILSLFTPKALVIAILSFAAVFVASQFTPVGWAADIGIALTGIFIGSALFSATQHLIRFADARNATTDAELDQAGKEFADAVAEIEIDAIILLLTHGVGGGSGGGVALEEASTTKVVLAVTSDGRLIPVIAETVPSTISVAAGAQLGAKGAAAGTALLSTGSGSIPKDAENPEGTQSVRDTPPGTNPVSEGKEVGNWVHSKAKNYEKLPELIPNQPNIISDTIPSDAIPEYPVRRQGYTPGREPKIDRLDRASNTVIEIKPRGLEDQGLAEAKTYAQDMDILEPLPNGAKWKAKCVTYDYDLVSEFLKRIGYL